MKLIVISNSSIIENETEIVTKLFEAGLETFHLRNNRLSTRRMKEYIESIPAHFHNRIVIHSHHNLARKFKLKGVHLTKAHKTKQFQTWITIKFVQLIHPKIEITTSFNRIGQLFDENLKYDYTYVFLSPVFDSLSSKFQSGFTEHSLKSACEKTKYKVIARGGVDIDAIEKAYRIGFEGLAFYSSIWKKKEPLVEFNRIIEKFTELNIPIE